VLEKPTAGPGVEVVGGVGGAELRMAREAKERRSHWEVEDGKRSHTQVLSRDEWHDRATHFFTGHYRKYRIQ
jgi:hypothetical protein